MRKWHVQDNFDADYPLEAMLDKLPEHWEVHSLHCIPGKGWVIVAVDNHAGNTGTLLATNPGYPPGFCSDLSEDGGA